MLDTQIKKACWIMLIASLLIYSRLIVHPFSLTLFAIFLAGNFFYCLAWIAGYLIKKRMAYDFFLSFFIVLASTPLLIFKQAALGLDVFYIPSDSMHPTLKTMDIVFCDTWDVDGLLPGDIVLFVHPTHKERIYIKRIEKITTTESANHLFVKGDNYRHSEDSRTFGEISDSSVRCKAKWALTPSHNIKHWSPRSL